MLQFVYAGTKFPGHLPYLPCTKSSNQGQQTQQFSANGTQFLSQSHYVIQAGLELTTTLLPRLPQCREHRHLWPRLASKLPFISLDSHSGSDSPMTRKIPAALSNKECSAWDPGTKGSKGRVGSDISTWQSLFLPLWTSTISAVLAAPVSLATMPDIFRSLFGIPVACPPLGITVANGPIALIYYHFHKGRLCAAASQPAWNCFIVLQGNWFLPYVFHLEPQFWERISGLVRMAPDTSVTHTKKLENPTH